MSNMILKLKSEQHFTQEPFFCLPAGKGIDRRLQRGVHPDPASLSAERIWETAH